MYNMFQPQLQSGFYPQNIGTKQEVVKVNGENGARAYQIPPNSSALLLDESGLIVWLVVTDGAGYKSVMAYDITPHKSEPVIDFGSIETRLSRLEELINGYTNDTSTAEQNSKSTNQPSGQPDKRHDGYTQKHK